MSDNRDVNVYLIVDDGDKQSITKIPMTWNYGMVDGPGDIAEEIADLIQTTEF